MLSTSQSSISSAAFGQTPNGSAVVLYTLRNRQGMEARIATFGGRVTALTAPDRRGEYADIVLGHDHLDPYLHDRAYFGALIGRYANRIARGEFSLDGKTYRLAKNNGANSLHGGEVGFDKVVWNVAHAQVGRAGPELALTYTSRDGEEGYPGNLSVRASYTLTEENALRLDYRAVTDQPTVLNLTHHSYFNLRARGDVLGHQVRINAREFTPIDSSLIPTGEYRSVANTPFDFREATRIGARIDERDPQLRFAGGYDHNWVIAKPQESLEGVASVYEPESGRLLEVLSTEPGLQFYSGNFLDGSVTGKNGWAYRFREGFCMEPQHFPNSPNCSAFPSVVLKPEQTFRSTIIYRFSVRG